MCGQKINPPSRVYSLGDINQNAPLMKTVLHQHLGEKQESSRNDDESWHYFAEGDWDLLGTDSNLDLREPIFEGALRDGCGGLQCTEEDSINSSLQFRTNS